MDYSPPARVTRSVIRPLPDALINQIAAGEVVERPASVIKELLENSLDSGATRIEIHLKEGGIEEIKVIDNGHGIDLIDLPLALQRHATSKIHIPSDLEAIETFGFRGEALSSIASVSRLELTSRMSHASSGHQIVTEFGKTIVPPRVVSAPVGTQITVSQLFAKTPARFKFLRSAQTELSHCGRIVKEIALANPGISFFLRHHDRPLGSWVSPERKDRFQECFKVSWEPLRISERRNEMALEAYLSPLQYAQARSELYLFINGRPVRNRNLLSAIRTAFLEVAGSGNEPVGAVYLDIKNEWVDVNVHPQKWEVRCLQQEVIYQWLVSSLRKGLGSLSQSSGVSLPPPFPELRPSGLSVCPPVTSQAPSRVPETDRFISRTAPATAAPTTSYPFTFLNKTDSFVFVEDTEGFWVAKLAVLQQRELQRTLLQNIKQDRWTVERLEIPKICRLDEALSLLAQTHRDFLKRWGFEIEFYGDGDFAILTAPEFIPEFSVEKVFVGFVKQLTDPQLFQQAETDPAAVIRLLTQSHSTELTAPFPLHQALKALATELNLPDRNTAVFRLTFQSLNRFFDSP